MFVHEFAFVDDCLALAAKHVETLGKIAPSGVEDVSIRDVACDAFEFLYESRGAITRNQSTVAFPLMRRAFESISLCSLFVMKPESARSWAAGKKISNADVRKALEHQPMIESVVEIREVYKHFSQGAHPNRSHVPYLFLGEGNEFTLGGIHPIDVLSLGEQVRYLMYLCYWYIGFFVWNYREMLTKESAKDFARELLDLTPSRLQKNGSNLVADLFSVCFQVRN